MSVGFGGGGWGFGFGYAGGGWGVSVGYSTGWYGWNNCWAPWGWSGWCAPAWYGPSWCAPTYVSGNVSFAIPLVIQTPVYYQEVVPPLAIVETPVFVSAAAATPVVAQTIVPTLPMPVMPDAGVLEQDAWDALAQGQDFRAEELFASVLNAEPSNPRARAGYGLAAALTGREATAAWAMRDALALRPDALDALPLTPGLRWQLTELARQLEGRAADPSLAGGSDVLFLAAAMRASVGDRAQAAYAMELAARRGPLDEVRSQFKSRLTSQLAVAP